MAGFGDELIATGIARGAHARGKRIAFGDRRRIKWGPHSAEIFKNNPNIAPPGAEGAKDIEWIDYYKGHRLYNEGHITHWTWNYNFGPQPGELFFDYEELEFGKGLPPRTVFIEPNVPWHKSCAPNKDWGLAKYQTVANELYQLGYGIAQFAVGPDRIQGAWQIRTPSFRHSMAMLAHASLVITPEGGLHHGAAAVKTPAVVIFGSFIPPGATGYDMHTNMTGGATKFCGMLSPCAHCRATLDGITVEAVLDAAKEKLQCRS